MNDVFSLVWWEISLGGGVWRPGLNFGSGYLLASMTLKEGHCALVFSWRERQNGGSCGVGSLWATQVKDIHIHCLPVRKSKLSGWLRPSTMTCKVCTVVCNLSAVFSIPSFSRNKSIFRCISGFPISYSVPPMNDKNLQRKKNKNPHHILIILLMFQSPYIDHSYSSQIHTSINCSLLKIYHVPHAIKMICLGRKKEGDDLRFLSYFPKKLLLRISIRNVLQCNVH